MLIPTSNNEYRRCTLGIPRLLCSCGVNAPACKECLGRILSSLAGEHRKPLDWSDLQLGIAGASREVHHLFPEKGHKETTYGL